MLLAETDQTFCFQTFDVEPHLSSFTQKGTSVALTVLLLRFIRTTLSVSLSL